MNEREREPELTIPKNKSVVKKQKSVPVPPPSKIPVASMEGSQQVVFSENSLVKQVASKKKLNKNQVVSSGTSEWNETAVENLQQAVVEATPTKSKKKKSAPKPTLNETPVERSQPTVEAVSKPAKPVLEIVLDERERDLYEEIQKISTGILISKRVLPLGDVLIQEQGLEPKPLLIIERKSLQDLLASIQDGRYTEQSFRLLNASQLPAHRILYCIEGMIGRLKPDDAKRVYSAITSIHYYKGMSVLRTWSVAETAELLVRTAEKIQKETEKGKQPFEGGSAGGSTGEYSQARAACAVKSDNITPENIGEMMLSQIPSVSVASAKSILACFGGDFLRFIEALKQNDPVLQQVYFLGGSRKRKISSQCMENIRRLLLPVAVVNNPQATHCTHVKHDEFSRK